MKRVDVRCRAQNEANRTTGLELKRCLLNLRAAGDREHALKRMAASRRASSSLEPLHCNPILRRVGAWKRTRSANDGERSLRSAVALAEQSLKSCVRIGTEAFGMRKRLRVPQSRSDRLDQE